MEQAEPEDPILYWKQQERDPDADLDLIVSLSLASLSEVQYKTKMFLAGKVETITVKSVYPKRPDGLVTRRSTGQGRPEKPSSVGGGMTLWDSSGLPPFFYINLKYLAAADLSSTQLAVAMFIFLP